MKPNENDFFDIDPEAGPVYNTHIHSRKIFKCETCGAHTNEWDVNESLEPILLCPGQFYAEHNEISLLRSKISQIDNPPKDDCFLNIRMYNEKPEDPVELERKISRQREEYEKRIMELRGGFEKISNVVGIEDGEVEMFSPEQKIDGRKKTLSKKENVSYQVGHHIYFNDINKKILSETGKAMIEERPWIRPKVLHLENLALKGSIRGIYAIQGRDTTLFYEPNLIKIADELGSDHLESFIHRNKILTLNSSIKKFAMRLADDLLDGDEVKKVSKAPFDRQEYRSRGEELEMILEILSGSVSRDITERIEGLYTLQCILVDIENCRFDEYSKFRERPLSEKGKFLGMLDRERISIEEDLLKLLKEMKID